MKGFCILRFFLFDILCDMLFVFNYSGINHHSGRIFAL